MNIPELLTDLTTHYNALIRNAASQLSLTASQAFHLLSIPHDGIPMSQLANKLGLDTSTLTRNIQKLEKMKLIKRNQDSYDKRIQRALLTEKGEEKVKLLEESIQDMNQAFMEQIDLESQENITDNLEKIVWAMDCIRGK